MKKTLLFTGALTAFALMSFVKPAVHSDVYTVDAKQSSLEWYAEKVTGKHNGTILFSGGEVISNHGTITGTFVIDMKSIVDLDMTNAEYKTKLENHLKSADFFDVEKYPTSKFVITSVTPIKVVKEGDMTHTVKGNLTIKEKTNEISFGAIIKIQPDRASCVGSAVVDRSKFDVKYGSKTFFADIGDKMIYDEFTLKFNVIAVK